MFLERLKPDTKVTVVKEFAPEVMISSQALTKMKIYVDECADEIGWLGTAYRTGNVIFIDDMFLFDQDVHATTTEITPEGLSDFAEELLAKGDEGIEIWNNLKAWGHSHVNMGVTPSGQDDAQMKTFKDGGHDWFIRIIANKKSELKIDLYDYTTGIVYLDLTWYESKCDGAVEIENQINELYQLLYAMQEELKERHLEPIKEEMKTKVRKLVYRSAYTGGHYVNGRYVSNATQAYKADEKKTTTTTNKHGGTEASGTSSTIDRGGYYDLKDVFDTDDDVTTQFTNWELLELAECTRFDELKSELELYGYYNYFTDNDVERIFRVMRKVANGRGIR